MTHQPRQSFKSPRFAQPATFMRLPHVEDARGLDVAIVGVPYDRGTSHRPGARLAPREIRAQSSLIRRAIEEKLVDGSRFIQVGIRGPMYGEEDFEFHRTHGITMVDIDRVRERGVPWVVDEIRRVAAGPCYMTFDIDAVDPAFAPGTGTPEVGGLTSHDAQRLVRGLSGLSLVGGDIVEVSPLFDGPGQITSLLAANLMFEFLCALASGTGRDAKTNAELAKPAEQ